VKLGEATFLWLHPASGSTWIASWRASSLKLVQKKNLFGIASCQAVHEASQEAIPKGPLIPLGKDLSYSGTKKIQIQSIFTLISSPSTAGFSRFSEAIENRLIPSASF